MFGSLAVDAPIDLSSIEPAQIIAALIVIVVGWLLSRFTKRAVAKVLTPVAGISDQIRSMTARTAGYLVLFLGFGIALSILGAPIQPLLAVAIIVGVVLFLALRGIADNFAAGILLQTRHPVQVGDEIEVSGIEGELIEMNSRSVVIATHDGRQVHVPNSDLLQNPLANLSGRGARRTDIEVRATCEPGAAVRMLDEVLGTVRVVDVVRDDPPPAVWATSIEGSRLTMLLRVWHEPTESRRTVSAVVVALGEMSTRKGSSITAISPPAEAPLTPPAPI